MSDARPDDLVTASLKEAWRGFKVWWIPLCALSTGFLFTQSWIPKYLMARLPELEALAPLVEGAKGLAARVAEGGLLDPLLIDRYVHDVVSHLYQPETLAALRALTLKGLELLLIATLIAALLHMALIIAARAACEAPARRGAICRSGARRSPQLYLSYLALTLIKVLPFFLFILPGLFLYVRLYFTGFIITERSANPREAMVESWRMTRGHFGEVFAIFMLTLAIDGVATMTLIGLIPATSFKYTLRAALYGLLKEGEAPPSLSKA